MESTLLYLLILVIPLLAQANISSTYGKYKTIQNKRKLTGFDVARKILDDNGLNDMYIVEVKGTLSDHFDSKQKVVRLSTDIYHGTTIAALSVASHECGHAIQDKQNYSWMRIRELLYPIVNFGTYLAYILFFISLLFQFMDMLMVSIAIVLIGLLFQIVTLPVEFDASKRALTIVEKLNLVDDDEKEGAKKMLTAAALTYVASVLSSILNVVRLLLVYGNRRD